MVWQKGQSGNPGGKAQVEGMTAVLDMIVRKHGNELYRSLLSMLGSDDAIDRASFWRLMGKRVRSADSESGVPTGGLVIQVITGVPSPLPVVLPGQLVTAPTAGADDQTKLLQQESGGVVGREGP
jgi:hypothetical protein